VELKAEFLKRYGHGTTVKAQFDWDLGGFSITVLFGPSGCGKTTILRCLAGLERPEEGHIQVGEERWFDAKARIHRAAHQRHVGLVFQDSALFPHLDVASNIAFGIQRLEGSHRSKRVEHLMELVGLQGMGKRKTTELSGGQCQRVALARALAPEPRLLLLDEPFASLDRPGREQLRSSLRGILAESGIPTLLVTHDGHEALCLGDRFLMMQEGCLMPTGAERVSSSPASLPTPVLVPD
jgi:molybdate transport system ATP-binding protein